MFEKIAYAAQGAPAQPEANPLALFFPFIMVFAIMYLLIWRPQSKQRKELQSLVENLKKGDKIVTSGGLLGTIAGIQKEYVVIKVGDNDQNKLEVLKSSITGLRNNEETRKK